MSSFGRRLVGAAAAVGVGAVALHFAERDAASRIRARHDDDLDPLYVLPDGVTHLDVPTHDGGSVHVLKAGAGRPLVLLHGVTLAAEVWAPLFHLVRDRFTIYALDVRGHGQSIVGSDGIGRRAAAHDLATVLDTLDLDDAIVVGHSMGGMIIGEFCGAHPDVLDARVGGLLFCNTATANLVPPAVLGPVLAGGRRLAARTASGHPLPRVPADRNLVMSRVAFGANPSGAAVEQVSRLGLAVDPTRYVGLWVDLLDLDTRAALAGVRQPASVLVGSRDMLTPVPHAKRIVAALPDPELHVLAGAGHQIMQERPRELATQLDRLVDRVETRAAVRVAD